jgi:hypothetical protein
MRERMTRGSGRRLRSQPFLGYHMSDAAPGRGGHRKERQWTIRTSLTW